MTSISRLEQYRRKYGVNAGGGAQVHRQSGRGGSPALPSDACQLHYRWDPSCAHSIRTSSVPTDLRFLGEAELHVGV